METKEIQACRLSSLRPAATCIVLGRIFLNHEFFGGEAEGAKSHPARRDRNERWMVLWVWSWSTYNLEVVGELQRRLWFNEELQLVLDANNSGLFTRHIRSTCLLLRNMAHGSDTSDCIKGAN